MNECQHAKTVASQAQRTSGRLQDSEVDASIR
jgi:hypothetical protein